MTEKPSYAYVLDHLSEDGTYKGASTFGRTFDPEAVRARPFRELRDRGSSTGFLFFVLGPEFVL